MDSELAIGEEALVMIGLNHRTAPIDLRDRVAFSDSEIEAVLDGIKSLAQVEEVVVLSTCNRTEIYAVGKGPDVIGELTGFVAGRAGIAKSELGRHLYESVGRQAARRLFAVAAGLDSMILGEPQILGQTREAYRAAMARGTAGRLLRPLFEAALRAAKRARSETGIERGAVSIAYAAVELARQILGDLRDKELLVIGAGKMSHLAMDNIREQGARACFVANRSIERAEELAREYRASVYPWERLAEALGRVDIVISSTGAPHFVVTADDVRAAMKRRRNRPLFIVDIAVPRDVEPAAASLYNVFLFNIDDLKAVIEENIARRAKEAASAEEIVDSEVSKFFSWLHSIEAQGAIVQLRELAEQQRAAEFERLRRRLGGVAPRQLEEIEEFSRRLMNKFLDRPSRGVKSAYRQDGLEGRPEGEGAARWVLHALRHLFGLDAPARETPSASVIPARSVARQAGVSPLSIGPESRSTIHDPRSPHQRARSEAQMDDVDRRLCDLLQNEFSLVPRPFEAIARSLGLGEEEVVRRVQAMKDANIIRQISAIFDSRRLGYRSLLAAFRVAPERLEIVAAGVSSHPGVSHAYERQHDFNLWFTMTVAPGEDPESECARLAERSRVALWVPLPSLRTFKIGVSFSMGEDNGEGPRPAQRVGSVPQGEEAAREYPRPSEEDVVLIRALQQDIPINPEPFRLQAERLGLTEEALLEKAGDLQERRLMRRFAAVLRHREAGYKANGMACWALPSESLDVIGPRVAAFPEVSHCYERRPMPPAWPYNLFAMLHGRRREDVEEAAERIRAEAGLAPPEILYSAREFKKERVVYFPA